MNLSFNLFNPINYNLAVSKQHKSTAKRSNHYWIEIINLQGRSSVVSFLKSQTKNKHNYKHNPMFEEKCLSNKMCSLFSLIQEPLASMASVRTTVPSKCYFVVVLYRQHFLITSTTGNIPVFPPDPQVWPASKALAISWMIWTGKQ